MKIQFRNSRSSLARLLLPQTPAELGLLHPGSWGRQNPSPLSTTLFVTLLLDSFSSVIASNPAPIQLEKVFPGLLFEAPPALSARLFICTIATPTGGSPALTVKILTLPSTTSAADPSDSVCVFCAFSDRQGGFQYLILPLVLRRVSKL